MKTDNTYANLLRLIQEEGSYRKDRTGVGTMSVFSEHVTFDLREGFPILQGKSVHWKSVVGELLGRSRQTSDTSEGRSIR